MSVLRQMGDAVTIESLPEGVDCYAAAVGLAATYRLDLWAVYDELRRLYGDEDIPNPDLDDLGRQIEVQTRFYEVKEEKVDVALALVSPEGFQMETEADGTEVYVAEIVYPKDREHLLLSWKTMQSKNRQDFGFHYDPYNFDSNPEKSFFEQVLHHLNLKPEEIEDIYFTGAITDPAKTDFYVEYKDEKGKPRRYARFPDSQEAGPWPPQRHRPRVYRRNQGRTGRANTPSTAKTAARRWPCGRGKNWTTSGCDTR